MMYSGILEYNELGRYQFKNGFYFTSGDPIELFIEEEWIKGRIEYCHEFEDYYFLNNYKKIYNLTGIKARITP